MTTSPQEPDILAELYRVERTFRGSFDDMSELCRKAAEEIERLRRPPAPDAALREAIAFPLAAAWKRQADANTLTALLDHDLDAILAELGRLRASDAALREALLPFANIKVGEIDRNYRWLNVEVEVKDIDSARAALAATPTRSTSHD